MPPKVLSIVGPTASGKTGLSIALALAYDGEVVSADSMQIYRGMDIGTAKVTAREAQGVPHHMIDVADPAEDFSVARYVELASACVDDILARGKLPIVVGGTGLYVDALISGRTFASQSTGWREKLRARGEQEGMAALLDELRQVDPEAAARLHVKDEKRIIRALEVWYETGKTITQHNLETQSLPPRYEALTLALSAAERHDLWRRIDLRVDWMMADGLADEVRGLMAAGVPDSATSMQAIGYKELVSALRTGGSLDEAAAEIKLHSRQYAKRQLTWFRRNSQAKWLLWENSPDLEQARQKAAEYMEEFGLS
jgi:tRNA dimethylallyltransferase